MDNDSLTSSRPVHSVRSVTGYLFSNRSIYRLYKDIAMMQWTNAIGFWWLRNISPYLSLLRESNSLTNVRALCNWSWIIGKICHCVRGRKRTLLPRFSSSSSLLSSRHRTRTKTVPPWRSNVSHQFVEHPSPFARARPCWSLLSNVQQQWTKGEKERKNTFHDRVAGETHTHD